MSPTPEKRPAPAVPTPFMAFVTDEVTRSQLERAAADTGFQGDVYVGSADEALAALAEVAAPGFLVLDLSEADDIVVAVNAFADVCPAGTQVLVLGAVNDVETYRELTAMGVADYLVKPVAAPGLTQALARIGSELDQGRAAPGASAQPARGQVTGVVSARGGAGASTVAVNLAWALASEAPGKCALVDLDLRFGTSAMMLDLEPGRGFKEALDNPGRIDSLFMERAMVRATDNLFLLAGEEDLSQDTGASADALDVLFDMLRESFQNVVVDVPRWQATHHMDRFERLILVTEPTLAGLRDGLRLKEVAEARAEGELTIDIVFNKGGAARKGELTVAEAVKGGLPKPAWVLPEEVKVQAQAQAMGKPMVQIAPRAKASRVFVDMARGLALGETDEASGKSLFGMILGGKK